MLAKEQVHTRAGHLREAGQGAEENSIMTINSRLFDVLFVITGKYLILTWIHQ